VAARPSGEDAGLLRGIPAARLALIERITAAAPRRAPGIDAATRRRFLRSYFRGVGEEDLTQRAPEELAAIAVRHLDFGRVRAPGQTNVHIFNANLERDGYVSPHTMVMVVTDDMPFLVDSVNTVFSQSEVAVHLIVHPVLAVKRDGRGRLVEVGEAPSEELQAESWQLYEIDRRLDPAHLEELRRKVLSSLGDVRIAVEDWMPMRRRVRGLIDSLQNDPPPLPADEVNEARGLLDWMEARHFVFLG
jgi:glutamate dehydrogenase